MQVPKKCSRWRQALNENLEGQKILENLKNEECLSQNLVNIFFEQLYKELASLSSKLTPEKAKNIAENIVANNKRLTCNGATINNNFDILFRCVPKESLHRIYPDKYVDIFGINEKQTKSHKSTLNKKDLERIIEDYSGKLHVGEKSSFGIVWVADYGEVKKYIKNPNELIDRLGLMHLEDKNFCILIKYKREDRDLYVPRVFDGINWSQFKLVKECNAPSGKTHPLTDQKDGVSEAIHKRLAVSGKTSLGVLQ